MAAPANTACPNFSECATLATEFSLVAKNNPPSTNELVTAADFDTYYGAGAAAALGAGRIMTWALMKQYRSMPTTGPDLDGVQDASTYNSSTGTKTYRGYLWFNYSSWPLAIYREPYSILVGLQKVGEVAAGANTAYDSNGLFPGTSHTYRLKYRDLNGTWESPLSAEQYSFTTPTYHTTASVMLLGEVDPQKPLAVGWSWVQFSVGNGTSSARWQYRLNGGAWSGWTTINTIPNGGPYESAHIQGNPSGDTIEFQVQPFSGDNLTGEAGPVYTVSGDLGEGGA